MSIRTNFYIFVTITNYPFSMETFELNTTQNVSLEFPVASVADRILALFFDIIFIGVYIIAVGLGLLTWLSLSPEWWMLFLSFPVVFYHLLFEIFFNGQSPGKRIMNIKVFQMNGMHLSPGSCFIRWIFRLVDINITSGALATIVVIINGKGQRLGDIAANTTVLKTRKKQSFNQTLWMNVDENYLPRFPEAERLSDKDVQTIREVLITANDNQNSPETAGRLLSKTRNAIEKKTNTNSSLSDFEYLSTIIKDYNACHR